MTSAYKNNEVLGPVLALDLGQKRIGVALSDQLLISIRRLDALTRSNWKQLLKDVSELARSYDAKTLVIGLPLRMDGALGSAAIAVREIAEKFSKSMDIPVYLQDERLTSVEAWDRLRNEGLTQKQAVLHLDSESAVIILSDFLNSDSKVVASSKLNDE